MCRPTTTSAASPTAGTTTSCGSLEARRPASTSSTATTTSSTPSMRPASATQATFSQGEGAFIVNKDGPVRAIRDFVGANSGPHVQRQHIFYDDLEVINTFLRVHPIPGVVDFFDYSAAGIGLTYENGVMTPGGLVSGTPPGGVTIDGQPDAVTGAGTALLAGFESVDGPQGALVDAQRLLTNNPDPGYHLDYRDGNVSNRSLCTGDDNRALRRQWPAAELSDQQHRRGRQSHVGWRPVLQPLLPARRSTTRPLARPTARRARRGAGAAGAVAGGSRHERPAGTIVVRKNAVPDDAQDFSFTAGGGLSPASFCSTTTRIRRSPTRGRSANVSPGHLLGRGGSVPRMGTDLGELRRRQPAVEHHLGR